MGVLNEYGESAMDADQWEAASKFFFFFFFFSANKTITPSRPLCERIVLILELITDLYMGFAFEKM